jgi:hypothetical protein
MSQQFDRDILLAPPNWGVYHSTESLEPKMNTLNLPQVENILHTMARISLENEKLL